MRKPKAKQKFFLPVIKLGIGVKYLKKILIFILCRFINMNNIKWISSMLSVSIIVIIASKIQSKLNIRWCRLGINVEKSLLILHVSVFRRGEVTDHKQSRSAATGSDERAGCVTANDESRRLREPRRLRESCRLREHKCYGHNFIVHQNWLVFN